jgi:hypothetical protein
MADLSESNTLELRTAFHNAVSRFQAWTADVAEPKVKLHGRFSQSARFARKQLLSPIRCPTPFFRFCIRRHTRATISSR